ncbi:Vacuolar morphogenesis protein 6 [Malassezia brasiliensis]|uniref:Vacuolar morphogenesis protein 6 n=1 Tax=Malassezia brasiliensis TaxID=1821822 RepID=A0AAF0DSA7_9BASI|nr:Vacuolar morphogenesis protein 6 [Malassezia brasiliensis]
MDGVYAAQAAACALPDGARALACTDETLYVGTSSGAVARYAVPRDDAAWAAPTTAQVTRRAVEAVCVVPGLADLALLSDGQAWLWRAGDKPVPLPASKGARRLAAASWSESSASAARRRGPRASHAVGLRGMDEIAAERRAPRAGTHTVAMLAVACKRHLVVYRWVDGVFWDQKTLHLPAAPVALDILAGQAVFVGCALDSYVRVPVPPTHASSAASLPQRNAETGATALLLGEWTDEREWPMYAVALPPAPAAEVRGWAWIARRDEPLVAALGADVLLGTERGGVLVDAAGRARAAPMLAWDAVPRAVVHAPPYVVVVPSDGAHVAVHLGTTLRAVQTVALDAGQDARMAAAGASHVYVGVGARAGASLLTLHARALDAQLDELEGAGEFDEALALLDRLGGAQAAAYAARRTHVHALVGLQRFERGAFDAAMDVFIEVDMNPAPVLALYPSAIAGRLARDARVWRKLFGARGGAPSPDVHADGAPRAALDALARFLTDRRRVLRPRAERLASAASSQAAPRADPLQALPPSLAAVRDEDVALVAQLVDTALFKTLLHTKPALVGALCRLDNWCEIGEVRALLLERGMVDELVSLYRAKHLHRDALALLTERADAVPGAPDVAPVVAYLHTLGAADTALVLATAAWVLRTDRRAALAVFTEAPTPLPIERVAPALAELDGPLAIAYLEHALAHGDVPPALHTRLALLYLAAPDAPPDVPPDALLTHLRTSDAYDVRAVLDALPTAPAYAAARALLLGRLGRHEEALRLLVAERGDVRAAEAHCVAHHVGSAVWLALLRLVLAHATEAAALGVLARHAAHVPLADALRVLPATCRVADAEAYVCRALRAGAAARGGARVHARLAQRRARETGAALAAQQQRAVRVTDTRTCAVCQRRLGDAVLAVLPGSGRTLHYSCARGGLL